MPSSLKTTQTPELAGSPLPPHEEKEVAALVTRVNEKNLAISAHFVHPATINMDAPNPVIISTWMKAGTTLLQQLVYQLFVATGRVPSDPAGTNFDEISDVVPFLELFGRGAPVGPIHAYAPTAWKTHADASELSGPNYAGARFIVVVRDCRTTFRSFADYLPRFYCNMTVPPHLQARFYELLFRSYFLQERVPDVPAIVGDHYLTWFEYTREWRDCAAVRGRTLFLIFEDVVADIPATIRMVARFLKVPVTEEIVEIVTQKCSKEHMAGNPKFNSRVLARAVGLDVDGGVRVRADSAAGFSDVLSEETSASYDRLFRETFGVDTYDELCEQLRERSRQVLG